MDHFLHRAQILVACKRVEKNHHFADRHIINYRRNGSIHAYDMDGQWMQNADSAK